MHGAALKDPRQCYRNCAQVLAKLLEHPEVVRGIVEAAALGCYGGIRSPVPLLRFGLCKVRSNIGGHMLCFELFHLEILPMFEIVAKIERVDRGVRRA